MEHTAEQITARYHQESGNEGVGTGPVMVMAGIALTPLLGFGIGWIIVGVLQTIDGILENRYGRELADGARLSRSTVAPTEPGGDGMYPIQHRAPTPSDRPEDYAGTWAGRAAHIVFKWWWVAWIPMTVLAIMLINAI